jgi:hypothetical protein
MEGKLIKLNVGVGYRLDDENGNLIATTIASYKTKISLKNCQAIERGYDLNELVQSKYPNVYNEDYEYDSESEMLRDEYKSRGFYEGAKAILEILGDKKFTKDDVKKAINEARFCSVTDEFGSIRFHNEDDKIIQSLQQTKWDVEIEMESDLENYHKKEYNAECPKKPKLDTDGCLILKRK